MIGNHYGLLGHTANAIRTITDITSHSKIYMYLIKLGHGVRKAIDDHNFNIRYVHALFSRWILKTEITKGNAFYHAKCYGCRQTLKPGTRFKVFLHLMLGCFCD